MIRRWLLLISLVALAGCTADPEPTPIVVPTVPVAADETPLPTEAPLPEPSPVPDAEILFQDTVIIAAPESPVSDLSFDAPAGEVIRVESRVQDGGVSYRLELIDMFNNLLAAFTADTARQTAALDEFTLPYGGLYMLRLTAVTGSGAVEVTVLPLELASGGGPIEPGGTAEGLIYAPDVYHTFQIALEAGEVVTIATRAQEGGALDTRFALYGPDGRLIAEADDIDQPVDLNARLAGFVPEITGTYMLVVGSVGQAEGDYEVVITRDTQPPEAQGAPDIQYGQTLQARFFEGDTLSLGFDGTIGEVIAVTVTNPDEDLDVDILVVSPFGQTIAYVARGLRGEPETLAELQLPYSGRYQLELRPRGEGTASFTVSQLSGDSLSGGGILRAGVPLAGRFDAPGVFHTYQFEGAAGETIALSVESFAPEDAPIDPGFALLAPDGSQQVFVDDVGDALDPVLAGYTLSQTGTYTVMVYAFTDAVGRYEITLLVE
ncbi:MAG: hypothetical protein GYB64_10815 [Chloroflexi bacterium]|nr:hypothetical protein [Chloroflexota bacterium]